MIKIDEQEGLTLVGGSKHIRLKQGVIEVLCVGGVKIGPVKVYLLDEEERKKNPKQLALIEVYKK